MERFIISYSRHGKILTSRPDLDDLVSYEEIFDAMAILSLLATSESRSDRRGEMAEQLSMAVDSLVLTLQGAGQWDVQMELVNAKTAFDVRDYAVRLMRPEFRE